MIKTTVTVCVLLFGVSAMKTDRKFQKLVQLRRGPPRGGEDGQGERTHPEDGGEDFEGMMEGFEGCPHPEDSDDHDGERPPRHEHDDDNGDILA